MIPAQAYKAGVTTVWATKAKPWYWRSKRQKEATTTTRIDDDIALNMPTLHDSRHYYSCLNHNRLSYYCTCFIPTSLMLLSL
jgi:hypothetical protein